MKMIARRGHLFPYTDLSEARLARAMLLFKEIILYRTPMVQPSEWLAGAVEKGRVRLVPVDFFESEAEFKGVLSGFAQAADLYRDPEALSVLRSLMSEDDPEKSGSRLISAIRGSFRSRERDPDREAQVFLHLIERVDREQGEIDAAMAETALKEKGLGAIMGVEAEDEEALGLGIDTVLAAPVPETAGLVMMPRRLAAWGRLLASAGMQGPLYTDRPEAVSALDLGLARRGGGTRDLSDRPTEALEPLISLPVGEGWPLAPTLADAEALGRPDENWFNFTEKVFSQAWSAGDLAELRDEAADLAPAVAGGPARLTLYMMPGRDIASAYNRAIGHGEEAQGADLFVGPVVELSLLPV